MVSLCIATIILSGILYYLESNSGGALLFSSTKLLYPLLTGAKVIAHLKVIANTGFSFSSESSVPIVGPNLLRVSVYTLNARFANDEFVLALNASVILQGLRTSHVGRVRDSSIILVRIFLCL